MIGNNSCGVHGLLGGKVADNVESLDIVLYDGTRMTVGRTSAAELDALIRGGGRVGQIYAGLASLRDRYADLIREKFPRIPRRVSGYNLDELLPENGFHVARALVGTRRHLRHGRLRHAEPRPPARPFACSRCWRFADAFLAADAVPRVLEYGPIGLEGFDALAGRLHAPQESGRRRCCAAAAGRRLSAGRDGRMDRRRSAEPRPRALVARRAELADRARGAHLHAAEAARVWHVRESALGATVFVPGEPDGWEGWEDAAVPPAQLGAYLRKHDGAHGRVRLSQPALRPLRPGLRSHAHQLRLPQREGPARISANSSTAPPIWCSALADRSAASTATARRAPRCCPRCSGRN